MCWWNHGMECQRRHPNFHNRYSNPWGIHICSAKTESKENLAQRNDDCYHYKQPNSRWFNTPPLPTFESRPSWYIPKVKGSSLFESRPSSYVPKVKGSSLLLPRNSLLSSLPISRKIANKPENSFTISHLKSFQMLIHLLLLMDLMLKLKLMNSRSWQGMISMELIRRLDPLMKMLTLSLLLLLI
jgi:hypothetical protein